MHLPFCSIHGRACIALLPAWLCLSQVGLAKPRKVATQAGLEEPFDLFYPTARQDNVLNLPSLVILFFIFVFSNKVQLLLGGAIVPIKLVVYISSSFFLTNLFFNLIIRK